MFILTQDKKDIVNLDTIGIISADEDDGFGDIEAYAGNGSGSITLGRYTEAERERIIAEIVDFLEAEHNSHNRVYRMPPTSIQ